MAEPKKKNTKRYSGSFPYIVLAVIVFGLSLFGAYNLWRFTFANLNYFTAERLSFFVLITGVVGSIILFRLLYMFAISRDVLRKRRIAIKNQLSATVLVSIGEGIIATDRDHKTVFVNRSFRDMMLLRDDVTGRVFEDVVAIQNEKGEIIKSGDVLEKALSGGERVTTTITDTDYYFVRTDGSRFPGAIIVTPLFDDDVVVGAVLVLRDVTKEKEIDQAKSEFVSLASHQMRTPLSAIRWYTETMLKGRTGKLTKDQTKYLQSVYDGSERMTDLVNALLNVSRIELGTFAIKPKSTDVIAIAETVLEELKPQISEKHIKIEKEFEKDLPAINVDPDLMRIVFQNLLSNAVKYTPAKGRVFAVIETKKPNLLITVSDTGYGIPKHEQGKIFSKMFRAHNVQEREVDGNGLGLYIVKSILDHSGGSVRFESPASGRFREDTVHNPGTTFYVTIPLTGMKDKEGNRSLN